jgi:2,3-diaminopropionate biosynthesis protein SbnB
MNQSPNTFHVVSGVAVREVLDYDLRAAISSVKATYLAHHDGRTINPDSYFLRFPQQPSNRIIALPAAINGEQSVSGIKWIASFPENIHAGMARASATLVLNDAKTGYPFACLEASQISAVRTAASAVLAANWCHQHSSHAPSIAFVGAGVIAKNIFDMFIADEWEFSAVMIHDLHQQSAASFRSHIHAHMQAHIASIKGLDVTIEEDMAQALAADVVVLATNASDPYIHSPLRFRPGQTILNISLRDIGPELLIDSNNILDDIDHCLKANTSPHLAEQQFGSRRFITGTLAELIRGEVHLDDSKPTIFSPFGLGVLDIAIGKDVFDNAVQAGLATAIPNFFAEITRW